MQIQRSIAISMLVVKASKTSNSRPMKASTSVLKPSEKSHTHGSAMPRPQLPSLVLQLRSKRFESRPAYGRKPPPYLSTFPHFDFFAAAALALAAFFLLLLIITMARNVPTTADASKVRMTGMRMAHTRGGKRL